MSEYVITKDKSLVHHDSDLWEGWVACNDLAQLKTYAADTTNVKEGISKWKAEQIPAELIQKVLGTLANYEHMETGYVIYRDPINRKWDIRCPAQKGSPAHVNFFEEEHPDHAYQVVGTIHIHPQMHAFWSGTDMADQTKKPGSLHMVFGTTGKHVTETLCTVFEGGGCHYNVPFDTVCEPVDFAADYPADEQWCQIIDKQEWTDPTKPAVPAVPAYAPATASWWSPASFKPTAVRKEYTLYPSRDHEEDDGYYQPRTEPKTWHSTGSPCSSDLLESLGATCGCAVEEYGMRAVLKALSNGMGVELSVDDQQAAEPGYAFDTSCYELAFDLTDRLANDTLDEYDTDMAVDLLLDYMKEHHPDKLCDAAADVAAGDIGTEIDEPLF